jgi:hypothetical protein
MKAYPFTHRHPTTGVTTSSEGMDLRDYLAGMAMQALIVASVTEPGKVGPADNISEYAYQYADAMLKAREPKDEQH